MHMQMSRKPVWAAGGSLAIASKILRRLGRFLSVFSSQIFNIGSVLARKGRKPFRC